MARHEPIIAFDAKMYKHFAIVTVALTGGIALLADGEKREAVAETAQAVAEYEPEKPKGPTLIIKNPNAGGGANLDGFYRASSSSLDGGGGFDSSLASVQSLDRVSRIDARRLAQIGLTMEEFREMTPEQRAAIIKRLNNGSSIEERREAITNATQASRRRSGSTENSDF